MNTLKFTLIGQLGLVIWALQALFVVLLKELPTFQTLTLLLSFGALANFVYGRKSRTKQKIEMKDKSNQYMKYASIACLFIHNVAYIFAFKNADAVQVDLINYLWPILVILFAPLVLQNKQFSIAHIIAASVSLYGVYNLFTNDNAGTISEIDKNSVYGYISAMCAAVSWACYTLISKKYNHKATDIMLPFCIIGAIVSAAVHLIHEDTINITTLQFVIILFMSLTTHSLSYTLWGIGIRRGYFEVLNILSYFNPLFSVLILVVFGFASTDHNIILSAMLICSGGLISYTSCIQHNRFSAIMEMIKHKMILYTYKINKFSSNISFFL